ncbi:50S ribosomal protein L34 [Neisseria shayeganii 871]|uniref:50S ribosomal protein L34 n=1 Tax=Neisseria shayeganii 871 TaxID=1032488 RepID=G4CGC3_9NEIS|nr:50S ribosomal protein L34 [Neisseria shayeganii 871]
MIFKGGLLHCNMLYFREIVSVNIPKGNRFRMAKFIRKKRHGFLSAGYLKK